MMQLLHSYAFRPDTFAENDWTIWRRFPADLRAFLEQTNGGFLEDPLHASFDIPLTRNMDGLRSHGATNSLEQMWAFLSYENDRPDRDKPQSILHEHFGRHREENFLPGGVFVIGRCMGDSLIAVSLNDHDYGAIHYWEWYWRYPWYEEFFDERIENARKASGDADALNYATLVRVSDSFTQFLASLRPMEDDDDDDY